VNADEDFEGGSAVSASCYCVETRCYKMTSGDRIPVHVQRCTATCMD
jgi:hypothetical protein